MPPSTNFGIRFPVRLIEEVDAFGQANGLNRSEAVRTLVLDALRRLRCGVPLKTQAKALVHHPDHLAITLPTAERPHL